MICERVKEQIPECLAGRLEKAEREKVIEHLETCAGCRNELAELGAVWRGMEALAIPAEPEPVMKSRFMEMMEAYQEGLLAAQEHARRETAPAAAAPKRGWTGFWPQRPVWQFALAFGPPGGRRLRGPFRRHAARRESGNGAIERAGGRPAPTGGPLHAAGAIAQPTAAGRHV